jgi:hypothetical protein
MRLQMEHAFGFQGGLHWTYANEVVFYVAAIGLVCAVLAALVVGRVGACVAAAAGRRVKVCGPPAAVPCRALRAYSRRPRRRRPHRRPPRPRPRRSLLHPYPMTPPSAPLFSLFRDRDP